MGLLSSIGLGEGFRIGAWIARMLPWRKLREVQVFPKTRYKDRLKRKLIAMPFLFRDMQLSARDDYVVLDVLTAADGELRSTQRKAYSDQRGPIAKFEAHRKAFLFADGGYGKTTLFRNLALEALACKPWHRFLGVYGLLPVYVPLKVVQTSEDFAIMDAIQSSDPYFSGPQGLRRLKRLGAKGKLIFLFDGYDEMPYTGGFDHVKRELEALFEKDSTVEKNALGYSSIYERSPKYGQVYRAIRASRIYLASRREFFEYNPVFAPSDVQTWLVRGLDDRRITLVEKIFSKYRSKTVSSSGKVLNAELFLQQLSRADREIVDLSRSPLFLTVMCYIYVTQGASEKSEVFSSGAIELVRICIGLLLKELDEYKSREFDSATRLAISNRRSAYPEEKLAFLEFFAKSLYEDNLSYFGEEYLTEVARNYFRLESQSSSSGEILRGLNFDDATVNIVIQIILSGLFVLVEIRGGEKFLDFPHRKFREVLAIDYFLRNPASSVVINTLIGKKYSELALLFVERSSFGKLIVNELIDRISSNQAESHHPGLFVDLLDRISSAEAESSVRDLLNKLGPGNIFAVPDGAFSYLRRTRDNCGYISKSLIDSFSHGNVIEIKVWLAAASKVGCRECEDALISYRFDKSQHQIISLVIDSGFISFSVGRDLIGKFISISSSILQVDQCVRQVYRAYVVGRNESERSDFVAWARDGAKKAESNYEKSVLVGVADLAEREKP